MPNENKPNNAGDTNEFAKNIEETVTTIFETTRSAASKAIKATQSKLEETYEDHEDAINKGVHRSISIIKQYPVESAIACLGIGFVIGKFLNREK